MSVMIEIAIGIIVGLTLTELLKKKLTSRRHRLNVDRYRNMLLRQDLNGLMSAAVDGYDYLFTRSNRELLLHLAGEKDESKRLALAESIAQDAADRFYAMDRGETLDSVMSDSDKEWREGLREAISQGRVFREQMENIRAEVGDENYERAMTLLKKSGHKLP